MGPLFQDVVRARVCFVSRDLRVTCRQARTPTPAKCLPSILLNNNVNKTQNLLTFILKVLSTRLFLFQTFR